MRRITCYRLLAVVTLVAPMVSRPQAPQPIIREIATIPGVDVVEAVRMPNGRVILYATYDVAGGTVGAIFAYDLALKRSTLVARGFDGNLSVSLAGDRIAYDHRTGFSESTDFAAIMSIDSASGVAAGSAQRLSQGSSAVPIFSPDGKFVVFHGRQSNTPGELVVVPVAGGPERTLATYQVRIKPVAWSADGKWIFVQVGDSFERVPVEGGQSEPVVSMSGISRSAMDARLINGYVPLDQPEARTRLDGRLTYVTLSGAHGEFTVPVGAVPGNFIDVGSAQSLLIKNTRPVTAHVLNLADGKARELLPEALNSRAAVWSPDGRQLAVQDSADGHNEITVMSADGSRPRRYPVTLTSVIPAGDYMRWSPDGRMLAYYASPHHTLAILDLATGVSRVVSSAPPRGSLPDFIWRPDGRSILLLKDSAQTGPLQGEIYEARLDGTERKLRDIGAGLGNSRVDANAFFISDRLLLVSVVRPSERYLIPTSAGPARKLPGTVGRYSYPSVSSDGRWLLFISLSPHGPRRSVDLMTTDGDSVRTLTVPFDLYCCWNTTFFSGRQSVVLGGETPGISGSNLFLVPLNGDVPRVLSQFSGRTFDHSGLTGLAYVSPDERALLFSTSAAPTSTIYTLDVSPILEVIRKR